MNPPIRHVSNALMAVKTAIMEKKYPTAETITAATPLTTHYVRVEVGWPCNSFAV